MPSLNANILGKPYNFDVPDAFLNLSQEEQKRILINKVKSNPSILESASTSPMQTGVSSQAGDHMQWDVDEALWFAGKLGLADTYRGGKQLLGIQEEEEAEKQRILNDLMKHPEYGGRVTAAYFGGMILDPAGWLIPAAKLRTAGKMIKHGLTWGAAAGATGYVDPEAESLVGEGKMGRLEQAGLGAVAGGTLTPFMGKMMDLGKKAYGPIGEGAWKALSKNPEVGVGAGASLIGYNVGEDTSLKENLTNAMLYGIMGAGGAAGVARTGLKDAAGRFIIPEYGLDKAFLRLKDLNAVQANEIQNDFNSVLTKLQEELPENRKLLYRLITNQETTDDPRLIALTQEAREVINRYGKELVDLGILNEKTWAKNRDAYLHRMYKNPEFQKQKQQWSVFFNPDQIRTMNQMMMMRGIPDKISSNKWEVDRDFYLDPKREYDILKVVQRDGTELKYTDSDWEETLKKLSPQGDKVSPEIKEGQIDHVIIRRDYTPEERLQMGEIEDASIAFAKTSQLMSNNIAAHRFFKSVTTNYAAKNDRNEYLKAGDPIPPGYKFVDETPSGFKKYGDLSGKWIPENIYHDIVSMDKWRTGEIFSKVPMLQAYRKLNSFWKLTKTAYNAPTHTSNFGSNIAMYDFNNGSIKGLHQAFKQLLFPSVRGESARLKEARDNNVFGGNYIGNELLRKNKDLYKQYSSAVTDTGSTTLDNLISKIPDTMLGVGKSLKRWTTDKAQEMYTWEDNLFRLGLYNTLRDKGMDAPLAARKAREGFVDYSKSAPLLEVLRNGPIPFASYAYGIVPRMAETMAKQPWKYAKWAAILGGINAMGEDLTNDPERIAEERRLFSKAQSRTLFDLPGFPSTMLKAIPQLTPSGPEGKDHAYWNIARMLPGQFVGSEQAGYKVPGLPDVLQPSFGAAGAIGFPLLGMNLFQGKEIPETSERFKEIARQMSPNLPIPGIGTYAGTKMQRGMVEGGFTSKTKENQTMLTAIMQNLGLKIHLIDPKKLEMQQGYRLKEMKRRLDQKFRKLGQDLSEGIYAGREGAFQKQQEKLYKEAKRFEELADRLGL